MWKISDLKETQVWTLIADPILRLAGPKIFSKYPGSGIQTAEYEYPSSTHYTRMYLSTWIYKRFFVLLVNNQLEST